MKFDLYTDATLACDLPEHQHVTAGFQTHGQDCLRAREVDLEGLVLVFELNAAAHVCSLLYADSI